MKVLKKSAKILFLLGLLGGLSVLESEAFPRNVNWKQLNTDHFIILYPETYRELASTIALFSEQFYAECAEFFDYQDESHTYVILGDHIDQFDFRKFLCIDDVENDPILLTLGHPLPEDILWNGQTRDWLTMQFVQQYTTLLRHRMEGWLRSTLAAVFPDEGYSAWMEGGMAAYMALRGSNERVSPGYFEMLLRTDVFAERLASLTSLGTTGLRRWPDALRSIVYGYSFLEYLASIYGEPKLAKLIRAQSRKMPCWGEDAFQKVYGASLNTLISQWQTIIQGIYQAQLHEIQSRPVTRFMHLAGKSGFVHAPQFSSDGACAYYIDEDPHQRAALVRLHLADSRRERLVEGHFSGSFSLSQDGKALFFCQRNIHRSFYDVSDLYRLDLDTLRVTRLTHGAHAVDPAIAPDGKTLVYVAQERGTTQLMRLNLERGETDTIFRAPARGHIRHPAFSPSGHKLAFQMWTASDGQHIYVMEDNRSDLIVIPDEGASHCSPAWDMTDDLLYFSSDRNGVPNILAYSFTENMLFQVTNVCTGVFDPAISPDGERLMVVYFSEVGTRIYQTGRNEAEWQALEHQGIDFAAPEPVSEVLPVTDERAYNPLSSLLEPSVMPIWGEDEEGWQLGLNLSDTDVLQQHAYSLSVLYGFESGRVAAELNYRNDQFYPTLHLFGYDLPKPFHDLFRTKQGEDDVYWERRQGGGGTLTVPLFRSHTTELALLAGYKYQKLSALTDPETLLAPQPEDGTLGSVSGGVLVAREFRSPFALRPEPGQRLLLQYTRYDEIFGSDFNIDEAVGEVQVDWPLPVLKHHVLTVRAAGGLSDGDTLAQGMFQLGGSVLKLETGIEAAAPQFLLHGYEENALAGDRIALATLEYHLPFWFPQRALWRGRLLLDSFETTFFGQTGAAWNQNDEPDWHSSVGGELSARFSLHYGRIPLLMGVGLAHGFDDEVGETQVYGIIGFEF